MADAPMARVVIVGGGFGGLSAARALRKAPVSITLIDRTNHHVFQPLLYQVATSGLAAEQITAPIRSVLRHQSNVRVVMDQVVDADAGECEVITRSARYPYDFLILATGARHSYFDHPGWERYAPGLKTISDATAVRRNILLAFEAAELAADEQMRRACLTQVLVGGGPTGVEMAGQLAEMTRHTLARDFRRIDPASTRIILLEAGPRLLPGFDAGLAARSQRYLEERGVEVRTGARVTEVDAEGVCVGDERISARTVVWAAGNQASPAGLWLQAPVDRYGRVLVNPDLSLPDHPNVFAVGDTAAIRQAGDWLGGVAQVAIQSGRYAAESIARRVAGRQPLPPFRYRNKGDMATIGRRFAIYDLERKSGAGPRSIRFSGPAAWLAWNVIHVYFLIGFANRLLVMLSWMWAYVTYQRGARLITPDAGPLAAEPLEFVRPDRPSRNEVAPAYAAICDDSDAKSLSSSSSSGL